MIRALQDWHLEYKIIIIKLFRDGMRKNHRNRGRNRGLGLRKGFSGGPRNRDLHAIVFDGGGSDCFYLKKGLLVDEYLSLSCVWLLKLKTLSLR